MNFGCPVQSAVFANERGDLLVGLQDQVVLVKFQSYLPAYLLQKMLTKNDWKDDLEEKNQVFDENLDFWYIYRNRIRASNGTLNNWHISLKVDRNRKIHPLLLSNNSINRVSIMDL